MQAEQIRPQQFFQLRCGEVIRVNSVELKKVHCDLFDTDAKQWIRLKTPMPTWTVYAPCADPTNNDKCVRTIWRWWNSRRRASSAIAK